MDDAGPEVGMHDIYLQDFQSWRINSESDLLQRMDIIIFLFQSKLIADTTIYV